MIARAVLALALCAAGAFGSPADRAITRNRDRRDTFFDIITDKSHREDSYKTPVLPVELPIKLGGHGSTNLPILVLPIPFPVYTKKSDSTDARASGPATDKNSKLPAAPPYIALRSFTDVPQTGSRHRHITADREQEPTDEDFDGSPIVVLEESNNPSETVNREPLPRRRVKYVVKKVISNTPSNTFANSSPRQHIKYINDDVTPENAQPRQRVKYVTEDGEELISKTPRQRVKYITDDVTAENAQPRQRVKYVTEDGEELISKTPRQRVKYITDDVTAESAQPRQRVKYVTEDGEELISKTPRQRVKYITDDVTAENAQPRQRVKYVTEDGEELISKTPRQRVKYITDDVTPENAQQRQRVKYVTEDGDELIFKTPRQRVKYVTEVNSNTPWSRRPVKYKPKESEIYSPAFEGRSNFDESYVPEDELEEEFDVDDRFDIASSEPREIYIPFSYGRGQIYGTSAALIRSYLREVPLAPKLPAVMPLGRQFPARIPDLGLDAPLEASRPGPSPPRPDFSHSMRLRIDLTVPRSDYTTAYDLGWHAASNTARTVVEDGATIFYSVPLLDGRMQYLKYEDDRMNGTRVQRCTLSPLLPSTPEDKTFPGLPDLTRFHFVGYTEAEGHSLVERWRHWVIGRPGELGAARGEALNYTHDFLLYRDRGEVVPLKYTVVTHSSVLGPNSDWYTHRYGLLPAPAAPFLPDTAQLCDVITQMKGEPQLHRYRDLQSARDFFSTDSMGLRLSSKGLNGSERTRGFGAGLTLDKGANNFRAGGLHIDKAEVSAHSNFGAVGLSVGTNKTGVTAANPRTGGNTDKEGANLNIGGNYIGEALGSVAGEFIKGAASAAKDFFNPIGDFLGLTRPAKYDSMFNEFKQKYKRRYRDDDEEAVRKAQFIKTNRFTEAGNLIANTFKMGINYFADRIKEEMKSLTTGVPEKLPPGTSPGSAGYEHEFTAGMVKEMLDKNKDAVPLKFNWEDVGFKTPVHFQGEKCNSCALVAATGATEGALFARTKKLTALSPQDMIDCGMNGVNGCNATYPHAAFAYIESKGLPALEDYQFLKGEQDSCQGGKRRVTKIKKFYQIYSNTDKDVLRVVINMRSPVVVVLSGVDAAKSLQTITDGALDDTRWCGTSSMDRHAVLAVGYDFTNKETFTIKNSWGEGWGEGGYADIVATHCGLLDDASYPIVTEEDILE